MQAEVSAASGNVLVLVLCLGILLLLLPRRYALAPMMIGACYLGLGQALIIGGAHFHLLRILIAFGLIRLFLRREIFSVKLNSIDRVLLAWLMASSFLYVLFGGTETLFERLGILYNTIGIYFLVRALVQDLDDIVLVVKMLAIIIIPLVIPFAIEYITGKNPFSILGGVPEFSQVRDGRIRCQGAFRHPILAGTFGATAIPLFVGLLVYNTRGYLLTVGAILAATFIVIVSASSGPLLTYLASFIGLSCWTFKSHMRAIRRGIVILLVALHLYMKAPVWFVIDRLANLFGGGGWYRSALIDTAFHHFDEWWIFGTEYTAHWMPTGLRLYPNKVDMVNHYLAQGVNGGILSMILFIWLIVKCFQATGLTVHNQSELSSSGRFMIWCLGCTLFSHAVSFFSVSYFDQMVVFLFLLIGMFAALVPNAKKEGYECEPGENLDTVQSSTQVRG